MQAMGIPVWMPKGRAREAVVQPVVAQTVAQLSPVVPEIRLPPSKPIPNLPNLPDCSRLDWDELRSTVLACTRCAISKTRTQAVFGVGDRQARWMIIGEAPGGDEDRQGEPFVGKAGQLLNNMLLAIGLPRESVYIANILKCRPPNNRDPQPEEAGNCRGYLERQIELVNPTLILVVGRIAAQNLLQTKAPLAQLRGREHRTPVGDRPVIVTYHPAYLLRQPVDKRKAWQDLQLAREVFARYAG
jgi:DNA polymerase